MHCNCLLCLLWLPRPTADQAWIACTDTASNTCKSVDESDVDNWRNVLVSQCSTVTPPSAGQGECKLNALTASCQAILCLHMVHTPLLQAWHRYLHVVSSITAVHVKYSIMLCCSWQDYVRTAVVYMYQWCFQH